jgi:hypothetical protein
MSHFTVLVINDNIEEQLEPFYELECSMNQKDMKNDPRAEFVEEMTTEELTEDFLKNRNEDPEYYYDTLEDFASEYHGYIKDEVEEVWGRFTNPNSKWDWYQIGGRWTGMFKIKENPKYPEDIQVGSTGLMTERAEPGYADSIRLCDIDFEGMKKDKKERAEKNWLSIQDKLSKDDKNVFWEYGIDKNTTKEQFIEDSCRFSTYALLKDGEWYAKGEMGWWAVSSNEDENWFEEFDKMIKSLPENTLLTVVDCHI